jgi:hypothetical protein
MTTQGDAQSVSAHYGRHGLAESILAAVRATGKDPDALTTDDLALVDSFHTQCFITKCAICKSSVSP